MKVLTVCLGLCLVFVFVWERADMIRIGYHVERLKQDKVMLERQRDELRVKASALSAPERIAKVAAEKLGMSPPQQGQIVIVQSQPSSEQPPVEVVSVDVRIARNFLPSER